MNDKEKELLKEFVKYWHSHWGNNWGIYNYAVNDSVDIALEQFIKERDE